MSTVATTFKLNRGDSTLGSECDASKDPTVTATTTPIVNNKESVTNLDQEITRSDHLNSLIKSLEREGILSIHTEADQMPSTTSGSTSTPPPNPPSQINGDQQIINHNEKQMYQPFERFNTVNDPRIVKDVSWMKSGAPSNTPVLSPDRNQKVTRADKTASNNTSERHQIRDENLQSSNIMHQDENYAIGLVSGGVDAIVEPSEGTGRLQFVIPSTKLAGLSVVPPPPVPSINLFSSSPSKKAQLSLNDLIDAVNAHASIDCTASSSPLAKQHGPFYPNPFQPYNSTISNYTTTDNLFSSRNQNLSSSFLQGHYNESYYLNNYDILDNAFKNKLDQNLNSAFNKPNLNSTAPSSSNTVNGTFTKLLMPMAPIPILQKTVNRSISSSPLPKFETDFPDPKPMIDIFQTSSVSLSDNEDQELVVHRRSKSLSEGSAVHQTARPFKLRPKISNPAKNLPKLSDLIPKDEFPSYISHGLNPIVPRKRPRKSKNTLVRSVEESAGDDEQETDQVDVIASNTVSNKVDVFEEQKYFTEEDDNEDEEDEEDEENILGAIETTGALNTIWKFKHVINGSNETDEETDEDPAKRSTNRDHESSIQKKASILEEEQISKPLVKVPAKRGRPRKHPVITQQVEEKSAEASSDEGSLYLEETKNINNKDPKKRGRKPKVPPAGKPSPTENSKQNKALTNGLEIPKKKQSMSHPTRKKNSPPEHKEKPPAKPTLENINGKLVKVRVDKNRKKVLVLPRSKNGCWTCRIRKKKCSEEKPHCFQCLKLDLECDGYGIEKPNFMMNVELQKEKLNHIKIHTSQRKKLGLIKYEDLVKAGKIIPANNVKNDDLAEADIMDDCINDMDYVS